LLQFNDQRRKIRTTGLYGISPALMLGDPVVIFMNFISIDRNSLPMTGAVFSYNILYTL